MDRLNKLRGDADASRDSTLDSSTLGEAYLTANDSSKYFSLSEIESSSTVSSSKEAADDVTADRSLSHAERIISNLSPIPKKSELDSFKIGEQIEAANILSGGVNIFDDNENSYDGDELVIDDAIPDGDDKSAEAKLDETEDDKTDTGLEDADAAVPSKDTEVVLQIDGKNVDAIDIGNGLYLYRKDGEEELAAVQILDDNQQQPDIKFLKVRENAEGNLEVYEEIEIEVPKEMPTKEGNVVKSTPHIPVKDINKISEPVSNKVIENKSQVVRNDTSISEAELDMNKDNAHMEAKTEVNLNGKMMKFSESRKSPLIGTFTPMTYHSTPNKEGIPLTKTMVDLQLHPNRHSENVKKTIEVHTDSCKQRLLETPPKSTKDLNESNKSSEHVSSTSDKGVTNYIVADSAVQSNQENDKDINQTSTVNHEIINVVVNEGKSINDKYVDTNVKDEKTGISDIKMSNTALDNTLDIYDATCKFNMKPFNERDNVKSLMNEASHKLDTEVTEVKTYFGVEGSLQTETNEVIQSQYTASEDIKLNDDIKGSTSVKIQNNANNKNDNSNLNIENVKKNTGSKITENENISDIIISNTDAMYTDKSGNSLKTTQHIVIDPIDVTGKHASLLQNDSEIKDINNVKNSVGILESPPTLELNQKIKHADDLMTSDKPDSNISIKEFENQAPQILKTPDDENIKTVVRSKLLASGKDMEVDRNIEPVQEEPVTCQKNLKPAVIKTDTVLPQPGPLINLLGDELKETGIKSVPDLKQQENECKTKPLKAEIIKNDIESKLIKHEDKCVNIDCSSSKNPKVVDTNVEKKIQIDKKNELDKISKGSIKKVDSKSNQLQSISSKIDAYAPKPIPNVNKVLNKDLMTTDQNSSRKSAPIMKPNILEKVEIHKKPESNQISFMASKNTKDTLFSPDLKVPHASTNALSEAEHSKNDVKKEPAKISKISVPKPININNNKAAVPFGKWTEANRQEFLNKIKESKVPINTSNTKQLKQPNDLNRRDILQKIDSQRQSNVALTKAPELSILNKIKLKHETTFGSKSDVTQKEKIKAPKASASNSEKVEESVTVTPIEDSTAVNDKVNKEHLLPVVPIDMSSTVSIAKKDSVRKEINNQDLIDKTIEGIINRAVTAKFGQEDGNQYNELVERRNNVTTYTPVSLDEIESKMNELHGIPFVERPPHELPKVMEHENKTVITSEMLTVSKCGKPPNVSTSTSINKLHQKKELKGQPNIIKANEDSDEEIIEHEPVTGDKELNKSNILVQGQVKAGIHSQELIATKANCESKQEPIITENDFDKFARRNSITYENCLTVNFDEKKHHNVVQTVVEKEVPKKLSRNEIMLAESKAKSHKQFGVRHISYSSKIPSTIKATPDEDSYNKSYQSKVQIAYQTVMTAKRQQECPITIIEDKPVKVVFMDGNHDYIPHQLNVQGKELSPPKKSITEWDHFAHSNSESLDSDTLDTGNDSKSQDDVKFKSKHQRKQVLTPVEAPELELIEPGDLGIEVSPKKKRKIDDSKSEKNSKSLVPKKSYLLNRNATVEDAPSNSQDSIPLKESVNQQDVFIKHTDPISAIDNLVKAAELLETQSENKHELPLTEQNSLAQQNSPVKRGRGRPRKYPLPEPGSDSKSSSPVKTPIPQKKPRLIDAKVPKHDTESEDDEINSDGELVKENWTMGKINENIVCPICNKLFRSENVVFKHVKHCTGPSPNRSDSDKRSPRRLRQSQESDWKSEGSKSDSLDIDEDYVINKPTKKRKSKEKRSSTDGKVKDKSDIIVIDDTPVKDRDSPIRKRERLKNDSNKSMVKAKGQHGISSLVCEFCGKTFRQLSYLVNHRLQHKNTESKKSEKDHIHKSLFSCEICKKEFRKLHHLVQHRIIHNPNSIRSLRKSSSEQNDSKTTTKDGARVTEDQSAGFRCEPCDKSFRKLHHLVEHRETHDEISKKCNPVTTTTTAIDTIKPTPLHHCDICKKTFKKLQHLIEHKEQHLDTSSEKSDDKSVQSSLSTKDIIHECPLCYMVFPNEHSLNKHHIICQRKKKQSAAKQAKQIEDDHNTADAVDDSNKTTEERDGHLTILEQKSDADASCVVIEDETLNISENQDSTLIEVSKPVSNQEEDVTFNNEATSTDETITLKTETERKAQINEDNKIHSKLTNKKDASECSAGKISVKPKKCVLPTKNPIEILKIPDMPTPKKKLLPKEKIGASVIKRQKTNDVSESVPTVDDEKPLDSSDDDEVRYMLNPDFQIEESNEGKLFMKVRAKKRNSLQIERPNSKDLMKRRISLQHPPKIPRLKVKPITRKSINTKTVTKTSRTTVAPKEPPISTDSDDSDIKYSFPESVMKEIVKEEQKNVKRQKIVEKRKSLSNIAKRKSLGKMISVKQTVKPLPTKQIKRRLADVEHRCDCGQLFSSAALLSRHTSLAHTPPRIRRRRSPPPENDAKPTLKRTDKPQQTRKTIETVPLKTGVTTRKSSINSEVKAPAETRKISKTAPQVKMRRSTPHKGVPIPEKMRKLMEKSKK